MQDSFLYGFSTGLLVLVVLAAHNWKRSHGSPNWELQANRLLTRYPLVFLSGKRSLFYFMGYWNQIPHYLASHGYEVFLKPLAWAKDEVRRTQIHQFLERQSEQGKTLHLIVDPLTRSQLDCLLTEHSYSCLRSVTVIEPPELSSPPNPLFWKIHLLLTKQNPKLSIQALGFRLSDSLKNIYLDRCQFLAERDLIQGDRSTSLVL